jgi:protein O-mannosyl-transferase
LSVAAARQQKIKQVSKPVSKSEPSSFSRQPAVIASLLLVVATLAFYNPIAHCGFVYSDDVVYVMQNPAIDSGLTWDAVKFAFTSVNSGIWHPLTWLSHALDCQLFGLNPTGHHYVSLLLHTANATLLFLLLLEATGAAWPSLFVAALFALHPQNVESVAWAAERKNVLSMLFFLLALWLYGRYAKQGGLGRYVGVASLFALGLLAKPQIITLPCVLLLWDYWPLGRMFAPQPASESQTDSAKTDSAKINSTYADSEATDFAKSCPPRTFSYLILEKLPLFALAAASAAITVWSQGQVGAVTSLEKLSLWARFENAIVGYARYIVHTFWPIRLSPVYPYMGAPSIAQVAAAAALLATVTVFVVYRRDRRYLLVGWFWFLGTLVPMIGIVQVGDQAMADRYAYISAIGLFLLLAWGCAELAQRIHIPRAAAGAVAALAVVSLGALTYRQLGYWRDGETLWSYALTVTDRNYLAHANLAMVFNGEGKIDDAVHEFQAAEALHQYAPAEMLKIGLYEQRNGHLQEAVQQYEQVAQDLASLGSASQASTSQASASAELRAVAFSQAGSVYAEMARYDQARQSYEKALQLNPNNASALVASALLAERSGQFARAPDYLQRAMKIEPSDVGYLLLADAFRHAGRLQEAQAADDLARKISPNLDAAKTNAAQTQHFFGYTPI